MTSETGCMSRLSFFQDDCNRSKTVAVRVPRPLQWMYGVDHLRLGHLGPIWRRPACPENSIYTVSVQIIDPTVFSVQIMIGFPDEIKGKRQDVGKQVIAEWFGEDGRQLFIEALTEGLLERGLYAEV